MTNRSTILSIVLCWDFLGAAALTLGTCLFLLPGDIKNEFARDIYGIGVSVLSIVFSVYFAALAIIISSSDDDFVAFLEEGGHYSVILWSFKWTLLCLFVALVYSIIVYALSSSWLSVNVGSQSKWFFVPFIGLFSYSLFAAFNAVLDSLKYSRFRVMFVSKTSEIRNNGQSHRTS
jgi:hypothetical protein